MNSSFVKLSLVLLSLLAAASPAWAGGKFNGGIGSGGAMAEVSAALGGVVVSFACESNQVLPRTDAAVPAGAMTLSVVSGSGVPAAGDIRVIIPDNAYFTWNTSVTAPVFTGAASGKMGATASYENGGRTVVLDVSSDLAAGDSVTLGGLSFTNLVAAAVPQKLAVDIDNDGKPDAYDSKYVSVRVPRPGGIGDGYCMAVSAQDVSLCTAGTVILIR